MLQTMRRSLAMFIALVMLVAFVPALSLNASAANDSYIYNWGTRGVTATSLSQYAEDFYEDNNTSYDELSSYSGGTGKSDAPSSALYRELQSLMKNNHDYINAYKTNNDLLKYTDCQNGGGAISSFYSGKSIGPNWDSGSTWNKEHTWPNSKGLGGNDENDVMMIRPTSVSENSSRGNTAYGKSSSYYNPNSESGGKYDLRGDVARIFLYVYVRWGNTSYAWGTSGVMESVDVLLEWMEADPVDTWELGRNDSVESITGTRNVFVDYPELAFLLFGEEIPADMTTPSGEAGSKCDHNNFGAGVVTAPTCTEKGYTLYICQVADCGYSYKDNVVEASGHNYVSDICSVCGEANGEDPTKPTPDSILTIEQAISLGSSKDHNTYTEGKYYVTGVITEVYNTTYGNLKITDGNGNTLTIYGTYSANGSTRYDALSVKPVAGDTVTIYGIVGQYNGTPQIKNGWITVHTAATPEETPPVDNPTTPPVGGTTTEATISFADKANRTVLTNSQQVWVMNGITVTNDKADSTSDVADYSNPARFYKSSKVTIAYPGMTKIVIVCNTTTYANNCVGSIGSQASVNNKEVTVTLDSAVDSFEFIASVAQIRIDSITVYAQSNTSLSPTQCTHTNTTIVGTTQATCTTSGFTGKTICSQCNSILDEGKVIAVLEHSDTNNDQLCDACGEKTAADGHIYTAWVVVRTPTCTAAGLERRDCDHCSDYETREIEALGHNDANNDGICDTCGEKTAKDEENNPDNEDTTEDEEHICEEVTGFKAFINSIINFFRKLFGQPELCACGETIQQ